MKTFILAFILLLTTGILKTASGQDTIYWSASYKLKWNDFQGIPDTPSKYGAISNCGIKYKLSANEDSFKATVFCYFIKSKSWSIFKNSDTLLMHEQGHFDISELFARKLRKAFAEYKFNYTTVKIDIDQLFKLNNQERVKMDSLYDKETNLSRNGKQQLLWNQKIKAELGKVEKYASF
jgi:hypothetical protein